MDVNKILSADILDIIFDGRNKDYGAYELRRTYNKRMVTALVATVAVCLLVSISNPFWQERIRNAIDIINN